MERNQKHVIPDTSGQTQGMAISKIRSGYQERKSAYEREEQRFRKYSNIFSWLRLLAFIAIIVSIYIGLSTARFTVGFSAAILFSIFMGLFIFLNSKYNKICNYYERLAAICSGELKALDFDFLEFPYYPEFIDHDHPYADDLDLLGQASIFQYINRTVTEMGRLRPWIG
jgi:hypothetical protein